MPFSHTNKLELFKHLMTNDALHHAYLLFGPATSKTSKLAYEIALILENGDPGHPTSPTLSPPKGNPPRADRMSDVPNTEKPLLDTLIIPPTSDVSKPKPTISINEVRQIKNFLSQTPIHSKKRTAIIKNAEDITWQAQPALLKIVEEPPKSALIIFTAKDPSVLSPALRSRLHKLYIPQQNPKPGITPHESEKEKPLRVEIEEKIITLYNQDKIKHTPKISFLLKKLESATRFNLNPKIQRKSVDRILSDL